MITRNESSDHSGAPSLSEQAETIAARDAAILRQRAEDYAQSGQEQAQQVLEVVEFIVHGEHYFTELAAIDAVVAMAAATPLPLTPPWLLGVINHSGSTVALVDPTEFLSHTTLGITDRRHILVLATEPREFAIVVDSCESVHQIPVDSVTMLANVESSSSIILGRHPEYGEYINIARLIEVMSVSLQHSAARATI